MKKGIYTAALILLLAPSLSASAQEADVRVQGEVEANDPRFIDKVRARLDFRAEKNADAEVRRASSTEVRVEMQQDLAKRKADHTIELMQATLRRLEGIIARIESRIAKIADDGGETEAAAGFVAEAKLDILEASTSIDALASIDLSAERAQENFKAVREAGAEAKAHIKSAHENLMKAVRSLKSANVSAETTAEVEAN